MYLLAPLLQPVQVTAGTLKPSRIPSSPLRRLHHKQTNRFAIKQPQPLIMHKNYPPLERCEPEAGVLIRLVFSNDDGVRYRQQADHSGTTDEF